MSATPPFRRPKLHLSLTPLLGSPQRTPFLAPLLTPGNTIVTYSPFRSAGLKPPTPYGGPMRFAPKPSDSGTYRNYTCFRIKRALFSRALWLSLVFGGLVLWWVIGGKELEKVKLRAGGIGTDILGGPSGHDMRDMQFFPASNPKIHYIGRWTPTPNQLRRDGTFPGVYFDIIVRNSTSLHLSLHNAPENVLDGDGDRSHSSSAVPGATPVVNPGHFNFIHPHAKPAPPISLLARVDDEEYILLPNCAGLVSVRSNDLGRHLEHRIRVVAPMTDDNGIGILELEGIWLSKGGRLGRVEGTLLGQEYENEDALHAENEQIGEKHRSGLDAIIKAKAKGVDMSTNDNEEDLAANQTRKKILEVITDMPGSYTSKNRGLHKGGVDSLLGGVMGWEYLLGEMFAIDHVGIGIDGACLMQDCIGGTGSPFGMGDIFFRSGPSGSEYFEHPWTFNSYIPDVLVINLGDSDYASIEAHGTEYSRTTWDLLQRFETTYVSLIRAIRTLAYANHPANVYSENFSPSNFISDTAPASIPIFIMRPFRGQLEHATQTVVDRLRADGDKAVFWLDTSGWLDTSSDSSDFFLDESTLPGKWRLTEQGNQRVAIFLHMHVCSYLAADDEKCAFLPPGVYQGKAFVPEEANFDRFVENEKERKLKKLFWDEERVEEGLDILG